MKQTEGIVCMDRRRFLLCGCSLMIPVPSGSAQSNKPLGCRRAAAAGIVEGEAIATSGTKFIDDFCKHWHKTLTAEFGVRASFAFYDDGGAPNAYAESESDSTDFDSKIRIGLELLRKELGALPGLGTAKLAAIVAHECAHILQFKRDILEPWQVELHADYLAGWALGREHLKILAPPTPGAMPALPTPLSVFLHAFGNESAVRTLFEKGDTNFENPSHHGTPRERADLFLAGYAATQFDLQSAFDRGLVLSGVRPG